MVTKRDDEVVIADEADDLDEVLQEVRFDPADESRDALRSALHELQSHELNKQAGKPVAMIPGTDIHFRSTPTLFTALTAALGVAAAVVALPAGAFAGGVVAASTGATLITNVQGLFKKLNAQEVAVVGALNEAILERRKTIQDAGDATASETENVFTRRSHAPPAVKDTLDHLVEAKVVKRTPRDGKMFYSVIW